jgi:hypothetical protein
LAYRDPGVGNTDRLYKDMQATADYVKLRKTYDGLEKDLAAFVVKGRNGQADSPHG